MNVGRQNILVIDDDVIMQRLIMTVLTKAGYTVRTASHVKAGLDMLREQTPDLVLCDMILPQINGLDFLRMCRSTPELSNLKVIIISSASDNQNLGEALTLGAVAYLSKPFTQAQLLDVIADYRKFIALHNESNGPA